MNIAVRYTFEMVAAELATDVPRHIIDIITRVKTLDNLRGKVVVQAHSDYYEIFVKPHTALCQLPPAVRDKYEFLKRLILAYSDVVFGETMYDDIYELKNECCLYGIDFCYLMSSVEFVQTTIFDPH